MKSSVAVSSAPAKSLRHASAAAMPASQFGQFAYRCWERLSKLSLEAPLIAVVWQATSARALGAPTSFHHAFLLGSGVWLAYTADRWFDGVFGDRTSPRHDFVFRHRSFIFVVWCAIAVVSLVTAVVMLTSQELQYAALLAVAAGAYVIAVARLLPKSPAWEAIRRLSAALVFVGGSLVFVLPESTASSTHCVLWTAGLFLAAALNLFVIQWSEHHERQRIFTRQRDESQLSDSEYVHAAADAALILPFGLFWAVFFIVS